MPSYTLLIGAKSTKQLMPTACAQARSPLRAPGGVGTAYQKKQMQMHLPPVAALQAYSIYLETQLTSGCAGNGQFNICILVCQKVNYLRLWDPGFPDVALLGWLSYLNLVRTYTFCLDCAKPHILFSSAWICVIIWLLFHYYNCLSCWHLTG